MLMSSISITTDPSRIDIDAALALLRQTYWARKMPRERLAKAIEHSLCFGMLSDNTLVGLALVFRTIHLHDGDIEVQSVPDQGTTFRVTLPLADTSERVILGK